MDSRGEVQKRLKTLNPAQFEEVLFRLRIDPAIIPSPFAEQSLRAIRVIQRLEQEPEGLERLNQILDEPAISIIGEQYSGHEIEAQVKRIINDYTQQPLEGREEEKRQLDEFVLNNSRGVLLVTGAAGFGKSALLSHWQQTQQEDCFIAYHCFSYRYQKTRSVSEAYRHLLKQLYLYYNIRNGQFPTDENQMRELLVGMLRKPVSPEGKRLVIVLDGLDEASETFEPFFPLLPDGVFVIASARAEEEEKPTYLRNWIDDANQRLCLKRLSREAIPKWLGEIRELAIYAKDDQFVNRLDEITSGFPLYLRYLIDELRQVATQNQDVREVLAQTPTGFEEYVEQQLNGLDELKLPEQTLQLFALLAIAKGVLEKEDIKTLTQMRDRDLRQLGDFWQVTRWMQITERKFYAFAHPLLAKTFGNQLGDEAEDALQDLIGYCGKWQEHQSAYALQYYAEHLQEAKRWQELYELAHHQDYVTAQRQQLPEQPDLPLKTVQIALWSKAETDDGAGMAEFLLLHAGRVIQITTQESPLEALRAGNITKAWALADQFEIERCILWYLLLAWELVKDATQDKWKMEQARETLERLQQQDLPRLSEDWMKNCAVYLLTPLLTATRGTFIALSRLILEDESLAKLCQNLVEGSDFTTALNIAKHIQASYYKAEALIKIAKAQAQAENFRAAIDTAKDIEDSFYKALALIEIAKAQPTAENFRAAIDTAKDIERSFDKAEALMEIAKAQAQAENFRAAIDTAQDIENSYFKAWALMEIAKAQPTAENFTAAIDTAKDIQDSYPKAKALMEIAKAQAQAENFRAAIDTAKDIENSYFKAEALMEIAKAQAQAENFRAAIDTAKDIENSYFKAWALMEIAKAQPTAENFRAAIDTAQDIDYSYSKARALTEIAKAQPTAENFTAAIDTAQDIENSYYKARALMEIAKAQAQAENFTAAIDTAKDIENSYSKARALTEIAKAQPTAENFRAAIDTAQDIEDSYDKAKALIEIAKAQPTAENFTAAIDTAKDIQDSDLKASALIEIAKAQAQAGNFRAAIDTAQDIDFSNYKAEALMEIAKAQAQAENFTAAIDTAKDIQHSYYKAKALMEIAKAQPTAENFRAAIDTAQDIDHSFHKAKALIEIAKAQPTAENFRAAIDTAKDIDSSNLKAWALSDIAKAQVEAKYIEQALLTAEKILINRNEHLPNIAAAFVETGDKENFKHLLISCAYYLDAAYQMCGHLAQLYPTQVTDIAKVINNFTLSSP